MVKVDNPVVPIVWA